MAQLAVALPVHLQVGYLRLYIAGQLHLFIFLLRSNGFRVAIHIWLVTRDCFSIGWVLRHILNPYLLKITCHYDSYMLLYVTVSECVCQSVSKISTGQIWTKLNHWLNIYNRLTFRGNSIQDGRWSELNLENTEIARILILLLLFFSVAESYPHHLLQVLINILF